MNQEQNNLNPNNFNTQGNNGIPNKQPLNNQSFNQQPINPQPQPTPSFQQPINQMNIEQQTPQPMNNTFESGNANNQSFNSKPPKKMNLGLIIGIVAVIAVVGIGIVFGSKLLSNGGAGEQNNNEIENNDNSQNNDNDQPNNNITNSNTESWGKELQVPGKPIYFNYPDEWSYIKETYSTVLMENDEYLVAVCYNYAVPYEGDLAGLIPYFSDGVMRDVASYSKGWLGASSINVVSTKEVSVNGNKSVKFTGSAKNTDWDCHVYGYTFFVNDIPMMVMGLVSTQSQETEMISQVNELTDKIAASVHTKK